MNEVETCSVCGRTILGGEQTRTYLTPERERRTVCDLCRDRAERVGWVWEELAADPPPDGRRRAGLASLLRGRISRRREEEPADDVHAEAPEQAAPPTPDPTEPEVDAGPPDGAGEPSEGVAEPVESPEAPEPAVAEEPTPPPAAAPAVPRGSPDPAAPGAGIGRRLSPAESRQARIESALERFNHSEESVMIAGLARTLGGPWVSVGAASGSPAEVRITVAWELSWYQWGIDISDEMRPVYEIGKGGEVDELDGPARQWNAHMEANGQIELGLLPIGRPAEGAAEA